VETEKEYFPNIWCVSNGNGNGNSRSMKPLLLLDRCKQVIVIACAFLWWCVWQRSRWSRILCTPIWLWCAVAVWFLLQYCNCNSDKILCTNDT